MYHDPGTDLFRRAAGFGAWVTGAIAVSADVIAGGHRLHTATLGLVRHRHRGPRLIGCGIGSDHLRGAGDARRRWVSTPRGGLLIR
jgi:hypothetical protein